MVLGKRYNLELQHELWIIDQSEAFGILCTIHKSKLCQEMILELLALGYSLWVSQGDDQVDKPVDYGESNWVGTRLWAKSHSSLAEERLENGLIHVFAILFLGVIKDLFQIFLVLLDSLRVIL